MVRSEELRQLRDIQKESKWARERGKQWNNHVDKMNDETFVKKAKLRKSLGRRFQDRLQKRWRECWTPTLEKV